MSVPVEIYIIFMLISRVTYLQELICNKWVFYTIVHAQIFYLCVYIYVYMCVCE